MCEIYGSQYPIDFRPGRLPVKLRIKRSEELHSSDLPVDRSESPRTFYNDHQVNPGYTIDETQNHLIYVSIQEKSEIHNISLSIFNSKLITFRDEEIIVLLSLNQL